jgi:hypothetical protein
MGLWTLGIFIASIYLVVELRRIRYNFEELNRHLTSMELNFIKNLIRKK